VIRQPTGHGARDKFPTNVPDLLNFIDRELCREVMPQPGTTLDQVMFDAGRRSVAKQLRHLFEKSITHTE